MEEIWEGEGRVKDDRQRVLATWLREFLTLHDYSRFIKTPGFQGATTTTTTMKMELCSPEFPQPFITITHVSSYIGKTYCTIEVHQ